MEHSVSSFSLSLPFAPSKHGTVIGSLQVSRADYWRSTGQKCCWGILSSYAQNDSYQLLLRLTVLELSLLSIQFEELPHVREPSSITQLPDCAQGQVVIRFPSFLTCFDPFWHLALRHQRLPSPIAYSLTSFYSKTFTIYLNFSRSLVIVSCQFVHRFQFSEATDFIKKLQSFSLSVPVRKIEMIVLNAGAIYKGSAQGHLASVVLLWSFLQVIRPVLCKQVFSCRD